MEKLKEHIINKINSSKDVKNTEFNREIHF